MDVAHVLRDILVVLVAAKLAAELAERAGVPAVVGEIGAGIIVGPSLLGLVGAGDDVLRTLGEIGVILLLLDVGMETDLGELGKVGRTSVLVAVVGVVAPFGLGFATMGALGHDFETSLFVAAALTATSVGITARVFGDLRALATTEARVVLGAAVADDVIGLVVLTVVVRIVTDGSVSFLSVAWIVVVALGFLVVGALAGLRVAPPLFAAVDGAARSTGTLVALALAFTLAFAQLAEAAKLAPIVGAFVAGLALSRSRQRERIARELAPVGHLFVPVFFLQIGIDADVTAFVDAAVLRDAAILLVVAAIGKLASSVGAVGAPGDRWLIGIGMLPRGEVGLIFATIGLQSGVLGPELYAALLLVVLATTLASPQLLKVRYARVRGRARARVDAPGSAPSDGEWLVADVEVRLTASPPDHLAIPIALDAAVLVADAQPSTELLDWLSTTIPSAPRWDRRATESLLRVVALGSARSWRFLEVTGVFARALPELARVLDARRDDRYAMDPLSAHRWGTIERLRSPSLLPPDAVTEQLQLVHREWLMLAALLGEGLDGDPAAVAVARKIVRRLDLGAQAEQTIAGLIEDADLLWAASRRSDGLTEPSVLQLASHLDTPERARSLYVLSVARDEGHEPWELERLATLHELVQAALEHEELTGLDARNLVGRRTAEAVRFVDGDRAVVERIEAAPRWYVLRQDGATMARHARLVEPLPAPGRVRVRRSDADEGGWWLEVVSRDRPGLLATVTGVLGAEGLDVAVAAVATWPDGAALESFRVTGAAPPADAPALERAIEAALGEPLEATALPGAIVTFDDEASPWHTVCTVHVPDVLGALHGLATAFAAAQVEVQSATAVSHDGAALDVFELTCRSGGKLDSRAQAAVERFVHGGVIVRRRRRRRDYAVAIWRTVRARVVRSSPAAAGDAKTRVRNASSVAASPSNTRGVAPRPATSTSSVARPARR
jgi:Kef-type K+ transport system membrane component KefB